METVNRKETGCAKCGACMTVCPVFRAEGRESLTARGRLHLLAACSGPPSSVWADILTGCLLCGACEQVCPRRLPITRLTAEARSRLPTLLAPGSLSKAAVCAALARPALLDGLASMGISLKRLALLPEKSGLRLKLALAEECAGPVVPPPPEKGLRSADELAYFVGCFARHLQPSVAQATAGLLRRCGLSARVPAGQRCCGLAAWSSGRLELARELARRNIAAFAGGGGPVLTSCASCSGHLRTLPELFADDDPWREKAESFAGRIQEFTAFFKERLPPPDRACGLRIFWHDPCHLRFQQDGLTNPRQLLLRMGFPLAEPEDGPRCCGQGGLFHLACPGTAAGIAQGCVSQIHTARPDCLATTCSGCLMQLHQALAVQKEKIRVAHLAVLLEEGGGGVNCV